MSFTELSLVESRKINGGDDKHISFLVDIVNFF